MDDPARAERLWLAVAIATWWLLAVGSEAEADLPVETMNAVSHTQRRRQPRWRLMAVFHQGWKEIIAALLRQDPLPFGEGKPELWPQLLPLAIANAATKPPGRKNLQL